MLQCRCKGIPRGETPFYAYDCDCMTFVEARRELNILSCCYRARIERMAELEKRLERADSVFKDFQQRTHTHPGSAIIHLSGVIEAYLNLREEEDAGLG